MVRVLEVSIGEKVILRGDRYCICGVMLEVKAAGYASEALYPAIGF